MVINNAGIVAHDGADLFENWEPMIGINVDGVVNGTRLALEAFERKPIEDGTSRVAIKCGIHGRLDTDDGDARVYGDEVRRGRLHAGDARRGRKTLRSFHKKKRPDGHPGARRVPSFADTGMVNADTLAKDLRTSGRSSCLEGCWTPDFVSEAAFEELVDDPAARAAGDARRRRQVRRAGFASRRKLWNNAIRADPGARSGRSWGVKQNKPPSTCRPCCAAALWHCVASMASTGVQTRDRPENAIAAPPSTRPRQVFPKWRRYRCALALELRAIWRVFTREIAPFSAIGSTDNPAPGFKLSAPSHVPFAAPKRARCQSQQGPSGPPVGQFRQPSGDSESCGRFMVTKPVAGRANSDKSNARRQPRMITRVLSKRSGGALLEGHVVQDHQIGTDARRQSLGVRDDPRMQPLNQQRLPRTRAVVGG